MSAEKAAPAPVAEGKSPKAPKEAEKVKKTWYEQLAQDLILGGTAGAIAKTAMAPVERIKILMQTQKKNPDVISGKVKPFTSMGDCFKRVIAEEGAGF